jgi:hypothetical protein
MPDAKIMATRCQLPETNKTNKFYGKYFSDSGTSQRREIDPF